MVMKLRILFITVLITTASTYGQSAYVNTEEGILKFSGAPGDCSSRTTIVNPCGFDNNLLSIAVYKDTVYYNTWAGQLRRFKIGVPGSCEQLLASGPVFNALTVDKNGILYMANQNLFRYNPYTAQLTDLGQMPFISSGDLAFYKDKLLLAGYDPVDWSSGLYEININNVAASDLFMSTPSFFGLISYPVACGSSRYFGLSSTNASTTQLIELDLVNKRVIGNSCSLPLDILDAASSTETGLDTKVNITELRIDKGCLSATATVKVNAVYPNSSNLIYSLDNAITNSNGLFANVVAGRHTIKVAADNGACFSDTTFTVDAAFNPIATVTKTNPDNCLNIAGSIKFTSPVYGGPLTYTLLNTGATQTSGEFTNLHGGQYNFRIENAAGCTKDTSIALSENIPIGGCKDVFIANAFTPNGDGKNDYFLVNLSTSFRNVSLQVFNRWGNMVYQAKGNSISWDGTSKNLLQPVGTYIYTITYTDDAGLAKNTKGTLTLIR